MIYYMTSPVLGADRAVRKIGKVPVVYAFCWGETDK